MATNLNINVGSGASFASKALGWIAPISTQPVFAGFFGLNSLSNLAAGGSAPTVGGTTPAFTAGVQGASLPCMTFSPTSRLILPFSYTTGFTIVALCALTLPSGDLTDTVLASSYGSASGSPLQIRSTSANVMHFYQAIGSNYALTEDTDTLALSGWGIRTFTGTIANPTTTAPVLTLSENNLTSGTTGSSASVTGTAAFASATTLALGANADASGAGSVMINSFLAFDSALSSDDLSAAAAPLRTIASSWGVTV